MEHKFRHEYHRRQDKVLNPDYHENLISESQYKSSPAYLESRKRLLAAGKLRMESAKEIRAFKEQIILRY
jgi:hypothetical protein